MTINQFTPKITPYAKKKMEKLPIPLKIFVNLTILDSLVLASSFKTVQLIIEIYRSGI